MAAAVACLALLAGCAAADDAPGDAAPPGGEVDGSAAPDDAPGPPAPDATAPAPRPETPSPPPDPEPSEDAEAEQAAEPPDRDEVRRRVASLLTQARNELSDAELGVLVVDPEGRVLGAHDAERPMLPASTLKLVTAAAVLTTLGPEARLRTTVETTAPIDGEGVLRGDLYLAGAGDPLLATAEYGRFVYPARPRTPLDALADDLVAAGLTRLRGDVVGHAEGFVGPTTAEGWRESYFNDFNARHITGLTVDAGLEARFHWPDDEEPDPDDRETRPDRVVLELSPDPPRTAAAQLIRLLEQRGVRVDGDARADAPDRPLVGRLAEIESAPMDQLLRFMVQRSDNHLADTLLHVAGRVRTGEGSWETGERAALQVLEHLGVDRTGARLADGSGLSRDARLSALTLVELDRTMSQGRHSEIWQTLMAVAGEQGTLSTRLRGTPAQGRLLAKTGSLRDVAALSGFVRNEDDERHHFAVLANDAAGADRAVVRAFVDEVALVLTADLLDCPLGEPVEDDGPLGRPPIRVAC